MQRPDTLPHEDYYLGIPAPYLQPSQSRYHNLGMNGFLQAGRGLQWGGTYPGKAIGRHGDYGPRQVNPDLIPAVYPYPLDVDLKRTYEQMGPGTTSFVACNTPNERSDTRR